MASGHVKALERFETLQGVDVYNLGTGKGSSVLEVIHAFEEANGVKVNYKIAPRRAGDLAEFYADASKAERELHWKTNYTLEDMCRDSWNFTKRLKE